MTEKLQSWSKRYQCCRYCKTNSTPHRSRGLCKQCYQFMWEYVSSSGTNRNNEMAPFFTQVFNDHICIAEDRTK